MFCPKCGFKFDESECNFCPKCGCAVPEEYRDGYEDDENIDEHPSAMASYLETGKQSSSLPNTKDYLSYKVKKKGGGYYALIIFSILMVFGIIGKILPSQDDSKIEYTSVSITRLREDVKDNAASAKEKWNGKYIVTAGTVTDIDSDADYFYLDTGAFIDGFNVHCSVDDDSLKSVVRSVSKGDTVTVYGKVINVGGFADYTIRVTKIDAE